MMGLIKNANRKYIWGLFLIWPFGAMMYALRHFRASYAKNLFWAFTAYYGFTYAIAEEAADTDITRYVAQLQQLYAIPFSFSKAIDYFLKSGEIDILRTFLAISLSRFTDSQSILTLVYAIIFGFFFSRNMWFILNRLNGKLRLYSILVAATLFLAIPIWGINGFRFWTASHIYLYGMLYYLFERRQKGLIIAGLSILVHFSFLLPFAISLVYSFLGNRVYLFFAFFAITFFVSELDINFVNKIVENYLPGELDERTKGYRHLSVVENYRERISSYDSQVAWYVYYHLKALKLVLVTFLVIFFFSYKKVFFEKKPLIRIYAFSLLFFSVSNISYSLPSGTRFLIVVSPFVISLILLAYQNLKKTITIKTAALLSSPFLLLFIIVSIRTGFYSLSMTTITGNLLTAAISINNHVSLNDFIK